jgi:chromate transporter
VPVAGVPGERSVAGADPPVATVAPSRRAFALYFLRLGATGFGGPIALAGAMQRTLVEERGWTSRRDYMDGLALAQLAPGPLAAQLAMYLGFTHSGFIGASVVAVAFILPSFLIVWALSAAYVRFGGLPWMRAAFYGIGAAVIAVIVRAAWRLARLTLGKGGLRWSIAVVLAVATAWTEREIAWLFLAAGLVAMLAGPLAARTGTPAAVAVPLASALPAAAATAIATATAVPTSLLQLFLFFAKAGAFVFGSGLAIVPFLYGGVVREHQWITDQQFLDAVAVAMITPGPVVITVAFIGYLVRGPLGMTAAAAGVFLPVFLFVVLPAPMFRRHVDRPALRAFVDGVTAAATGAIGGAAFVLARRAIVDLPTAGLALAALLVLARWRVPEPLVIAAAGLLGLCFGPSA